MPVEIPCSEISVVGQQICITFPGGPRVCVMSPELNPNGFQVAKQLLAQANAALTPLGPIFSIIDAILAVKAAIDAIPDSLGPPPDPTALLQVLPNLAKKVATIASLIPQLSVPKMIVDMLNVLITALNGILDELRIILLQEQKIANAQAIANLPGNAALASIITCAQELLSSRLEIVNESASSLNGLVTTINLFLGLVPGGPSVPSLGTMSGSVQSRIDQLQAFVSTMSVVINSIPVP